MRSFQPAIQAYSKRSDAQSRPPLIRTDINGDGGRHQRRNVGQVKAKEEPTNWAEATTARARGKAAVNFILKTACVSVTGEGDEVQNTRTRKSG